MREGKAKVFEWKNGRTRMLSPRNLEEMMIAVGLKETNENVEIMVTTDVFADLCYRMVQLEGARCPCAEEEGEEDD